MKSKLQLIGIFSAGLAIGAIASDMATNGLYIFKSGDPIIASEVNSNFDHLNRQLQELRIKQMVTGSYGCEPEGGSGWVYFEFSEGGAVIDNDIYTENGTATEWSYNYSSDTVDLNTNPVTQLQVTYINDTRYVIKITPVDSNLTTYNCFRS